MGHKKHLEPVVGPRSFEFIVSLTLPEGTTATHQEIATELGELLDACGASWRGISWDSKSLQELKAKPRTSLDAEGRY